MATHRCALCYPDPVSFPLGRESVWVSRFPNKSATTLDAVEMSLPELRTLVLETSAGDKTQLRSSSRASAIDEATGTASDTTPTSMPSRASSWITTPRRCR